MSPAEIAAEIARLEGVLVEIETGTRTVRVRAADGREIEYSKGDAVALRQRIADLKAQLTGAPRRTPARRVYF